jgi:hypothetical protein
MGVSGQVHTMGALPLGERAPFSHWSGGWVGLRAGLGAKIRKILPLMGIKLSQPRPSLLITELSQLLVQ